LNVGVFDSLPASAITSGVFCSHRLTHAELTMNFGGTLSDGSKSFGPRASIDPVNA